MARPQPLPMDFEAPPEQAEPLYLLAVPYPTYKALSDAAAVRNLSLAQLLSAAVSDFLKKTEGV